MTDSPPRKPKSLQTMPDSSPRKPKNRSLSPKRGGVGELLGSLSPARLKNQLESRQLSPLSTSGLRSQLDALRNERKAKAIQKNPIPKPLGPLLLPIVPSEKQVQYKLEKQITKETHVVEIQTTEGQVLATLHHDANALDLWTLQNLEKQDIAFVQIHNHSSIDVNSLEGKKKHYYRLYATKPFCKDQEKKRQRKKHDIRILYHWADLRQNPSGLLGNAMTLTLGLYKHMDNFLYTEKQQQQHRNNKEGPQRQIVQGETVCATLKQPQKDEKPQKGTSIIEIQSGLDPMMMILLFATFDKLY